MLDRIILFLLCIAIIGCEKEPIDIVPEQVNDITLYYNGYHDTDTSGTITWEYYAWDDNDMSIYVNQFLSTNPVDRTGGAFMMWAVTLNSSGVMNAEPDYHIVSETYYTDWDHYNADYYYKETILSDHITNGDVITYY